MNFVVFESIFGYNGAMSKTMNDKQILREAVHLQAMENNPLDAQDKAMFAMFKRKGWSNEQRRAYILEQAKIDTLVPAAE
jgi:hypothetical protein